MSSHEGTSRDASSRRCAPNCKLEKWRVGEEPRLVLVALRDIPPQEELCYDYNAGGTEADATVGQAVSYTHLTLPTKRIV